MAGWSRERNRGRFHYVYPRNNDDRVSRSNTSRGGDGDCYNIKKTMTFKAIHRVDNLRKTYDNKINFVCEQLDNINLNQNEQFRNNPKRRSFLERNNNNRNGRRVYYRNIVWNLKLSSSGWYNIFVQNAENGDETIKKIQTHIAPIVFYPYDKQYFDNALKFLVDDYNVARELHNSSYKIRLGNRNLVIKVNEYMPSRSSISFKPVLNDVREKMIIEIAGRYNPITKILDLSQFYKSLLFTENELHVSLNHPTVLLAALNIVAQHTKNDVYCLSLKNNHIYLSEGLIWIRRLFPELKVLDLAENKFTNLVELKCLSGFSIEVLNLSKNPVSNTSCNVDFENYKRNIQQLFPRLQKLDNMELPSQYCDITSSKFKMPINQVSSYYSITKHNPEKPNPMKTLVESFISQYYELYDNNVSRQLVANTYHENATFSLSSDFLCYPTKGNLSQYLKLSRNLLKSDKNKKSENSQFLHRGRANIIHILEELPKTKHDLASFQVDLPLANSSMLQVVVNGVFIEDFKETNIRHLCRSFSRTFFIVPFGDGWRIINDMLFVTITTYELLLETAKRFHVSKASSTSKNENFNGNYNKSTMVIEDDSEEMSGMESYYQQSATPNNPLPPYQQQLSFSSYQILDPTNPQPQQTSLYQTDLQKTIKQIQQMMIQPQNTSAVSSVSPVYNLKLDSSQSNTISFITLAHESMNQPSMEIPIDSIHDANINNLIMVKSFSNESGMTYEWAKKCLEENNWDYAKAVLCFQYQKPDIPLEAFTINHDLH